VISTSFADIFKRNSLKNLLLPIVVPTTAQFPIDEFAKGDMSRPSCTATVVHLPSSCLNCLCEPLWRTSTKPCFSRIAITSRGFRTGMFPRSEGGLDGLSPYEVRLKLRLAIFQEHFDDLLKIPVQFVQCGALRMGACKPWNMADIKTCFRAAFDYRRVCFHN
jgi:hypothetical protein